MEGSFENLLGHAGQQAAEANPFQDLIVSRVRPELEKDEAIVMLMDAKGTLTELRVSSGCDLHARLLRSLQAG